MVLKKLRDSAKNISFASTMGDKTSTAFGNYDEQQKCFIPENDIVVPPYLHLQQHISDDDQPTGKKDSLAFFCGAIKSDKPGYSFGVRQNLFRLYKDDAEIKVMEGFIPSYIQEMKATSYCLAPPGHAQWSLRMVEAVMLGCVPVLFNENNVLPWEHLVDYKMFSLNLPRQDIPQLKHRLLEPSNEMLKTMQGKVLEVRQMFSWIDHPSKVGAFQLLIEALHAKSITLKDRMAKAGYAKK